MDLKFRNNIQKKSVVVDHQLPKETGRIPKKMAVYHKKILHPRSLTSHPWKKDAWKTNVQGTITYPTLGQGKKIFKSVLAGDMLVSRRVLSF